MRSKRRKRKKSRLGIDKLSTATWLWLLVVINVTVGLAVSPLTAVRKVRVVGASVGDQARLTDAVQSLRDIPVMRLNPNMVRSKLESGSEVDSVQFLPNLFGRAVVKVRLKQPVAKIVNSSVFLDRSGNAFVTTRVVPDVPLIVPPRGAFSPNLTILCGWEVSTTAQLCQKLAAQMPKVSWIVELTDRGNLSLKADGSASVDLGSTENLQLKVDKLRSFLENDPGLFTKVRSINLIAPEAPVVVPD